MLHFYDFEIFRKLWTVTIINPQRHMETVIVNDRAKLEAYYEEYKEEIFVGYNSTRYDQWIMKAILCGFNPKDMSDWIIQQDRKPHLFSDLVRKKYPIINYDVLKKGDGGLKTLEAYMGNDIRETTIPFDYEGDFTPEMIEEVLTYNRHDVIQTMEVFMRRRPDFLAQSALLETFELPRAYIGKSKAQLASEILEARRVKYNDDWDIRIPPTLQLSKYRYVADWFLNSDNYDYEYVEIVDEYEDEEERRKRPKKCLETLVGGVEHLFAWGGLHGAIKKYSYICGAHEVLLMADVDQLYPSLMVNYGLLSRAVREPEKFKGILATSLRLKAQKRKKERQPYKDICNITYGAMGDKTNNMYDPLHMKLVCVFGQLLILDLLEKVESFVDIIQSNTDGILVKMNRNDRERFDSILREWEERTMLKLSFDEFKSIYQGDVNNYVAVDFNGGYKAKGSYVKELSDLDNDLPIVNRAIKEYILHGVHPYTTIMQCNDMIQFQKVVKVSRKYSHGIRNATFSKVRERDAKGRLKYRNVWNGDGERLNDKTFRVFASKRPEDGSIRKMKAGGKAPEKFANTPDKCFIWNESVNGRTIPPYLDKEWYVELALKRLDKKFGVTA